MKFNKYRCSSDEANSIKNSSAGGYQFLDQDLFRCFCKPIYVTKKKLDMRGHIIHVKIKRYLQDTDVPALVVFLKRNRDVTYINLANNNISDNGFIILLDYILLQKTVDKLDLQNNGITEKGTRYLLTKGENCELKDLNLRANKFGVQASKYVAYFLMKNRYMITLNVADVDQTASSLIYFIMVLSSDQKVSNTTLESLDISRPNPACMYYFDSSHFADVIGHMLKHNTCLKALHLQKYNFDCHDIENMMFNGKYNDTLFLLDLGCNNIGDHGVEHITSWLMKRPALNELILCRNIITDHGARALSFAVPFSKLLSLDVSYNKITNDGMVDILNSLKKCPLLRQLKMFGNSLGHPTAKIIKRMLISQVLRKENIDVRPYKIDREWCLARYEKESCEKEYDDVPYGLFSQTPQYSIRKTYPSRRYYKYTYSKTIEMKQSTVTIISRILSREHVEDCKCCYCLNCKDNCSCCKCKEDSIDDMFKDKAIVDRILPVRDPAKEISYILKHVKSETRNKILRWINIDEDILDKDLKSIAGESESHSEDGTSCCCSWVQLSNPMLQKYLEETSSQNLIIVHREYLYGNSDIDVNSPHCCCTTAL